MATTQEAQQQEGSIQLGRGGKNGSRERRQAPQGLGRLPRSDLRGRVAALAGRRLDVHARADDRCVQRRRRSSPTRNSFGGRSRVFRTLASRCCTPPRERSTSPDPARRSSARSPLRLVSVERETIKSGGEVGTTTCFDAPDTPVFGLIDTANSGFADVLEGVAIEQPYALQTPTAFPPPARYWHLDVPADVSLGCNADRAHRSGVTGLGIRIAMVDTGQAAHPFFTERGYRVEPTVARPGDRRRAHRLGRPRHRRVRQHLRHRAGHHAASGEMRERLGQPRQHDGGVRGSCSVESDGHLVQLVAQHPERAARRGGQRPCGRGRRAVNAGIIVCFSASNGGWGFPAQMPDVIAVGGVFMERDGSMRASDYASGFMSNVYPGRRVPDVSGLVGMRPKAHVHHAAALRGSSDRRRQRRRHAPERR